MKAKFKRSILRALGHQRYLRFGIRDRLLRLCDDPETTDSDEFTCPFFEGSYKGNFQSFIDWSAFYYGAYAIEELDLMADVLETSEVPVVLDIGANVGNHTLFTALRGARVYAFEPFPQVAAKIDEKVMLNHLTNVTVCRFALGEADAAHQYFAPEGANRGTGSFIQGDRTSSPIELEVRRGDTALERLCVENVHFVKIDTEGYEPQVLTGLENTLSTCRPTVFFEWSQNGPSISPEGRKDLFPESYKFFRFVPESVVFGIFRRESYHLVPLANEWPNGNILAIPAELLGGGTSEGALLRKRIQDAK